MVSELNLFVHGLYVPNLSVFVSVLVGSSNPFVFVLTSVKFELKGLLVIYACLYDMGVKI